MDFVGEKRALWNEREEGRRKIAERRRKRCR